MVCLCALPSPRAGAQEGGTIAGRVTAPADDFLEGLRRGKKLLRYDTHSQSVEPIEPYRLSEVSVVYVETVPAAAPYPLRYGEPEAQPVPDGLQAARAAGPRRHDRRFPNNDNLFHNVFSYSQPGEFDLGRYPKGKMKSVTFDEPGTVSVYCDIHSYMFATILVLDNPFHALPADDGTYSIAGVPPGAYDLTFWYGRKKVTTKNVTVAAGTTTTVNFP